VALLELWPRICAMEQLDQTQEDQFANQRLFVELLDSNQPTDLCHATDSSPTPPPLTLPAS
jgi:hypothetical protein